MDKKRIFLFLHLGSIVWTSSEKSRSEMIGKAGYDYKGCINADDMVSQGPRIEPYNGSNG